jgi:hypothetical protein
MKLTPAGLRVIGVLVVLGIAGVAYMFHLGGASVRDTVAVVIALLLAVALIFWLFLKMKRFLYLRDLSEEEGRYAADIANSGIVRWFEGATGIKVPNLCSFIVIYGGLLKRLLFFVFLWGGVILLIRGDLLVNILLMFSLAAVWLPTLDKYMVKKMDYKLFFLIKLAMTSLIFSFAIWCCS